jgi:hypothetical protein
MSVQNRKETPKYEVRKSIVIFSTPMDQRHALTSGKPNAREEAMMPSAQAMLPSQSWDCPRELTLSEKLALQHFRTFHAAHVSSKPAVASQKRVVIEPVKHDSRTAGAKRDPVASFTHLRCALQEQEVLEASLARVRQQRALRGAKKLKSSFDGPLAPNIGAAGACRPCKIDATEPVPGHVEAHAAIGHILSVKAHDAMPPTTRCANQALEPTGEAASAGSLLRHAVLIALDGRDVAQCWSCPKLAPGRPEADVDARLCSPPLPHDLHNVTLATLED